LRDAHFATGDAYAPAGSVPTHYFHQDLWAARLLHAAGVRRHVDVGSRLDGFVAHVLSFAEVEFVDLRPLPAAVPGLTFRQGTLLALPFADGAVPSVSCLHVLEHVGLGRYGDPVDPGGWRRAAAELARVLAPGGRLLLGVPVGRERLCFDAHRVFDPQTVVEAFAGLSLAAFSLIDDRGEGVAPDPGFARSRDCAYGCGLFEFTKASGSAA
jgi:SAM-dependent methyltransferase